MAHAENLVEISKSPQDIYKFLADGTNNPKWRPGVLSAKLSSGKAGQQGAQYEQLIKGPGGRQIRGDYQITVAEPGKRLSFAVIAGPARPTGDFYLESAGNGTSLKFVLDYKTRGLAKLMEPMINSTMKREVANLDKLKKTLEA